MPLFTRINHCSFLVAVLFAAAAGCGSSDSESKSAMPADAETVTSDAAATNEAEPSLDAEPPGSTAAGDPAASATTSAAANDSSATNIVAENDGEVLFVPPDLSIEELRDGWISLFDGVSLYGWQRPDGTNWRVEGGSIVADEGAISLLTTPFRFADFEFRCQCKLESGGNSGIFLRTAQNPEDPAEDTYELNLCDTHPDYPTGSLVGRVRAEDVPAIEGEWHEFYVTCRGPKIVVELDGKPILDIEDTSDTARQAGTIGLQHNKGKVEFRNVYLRPLGQEELFNGKDLTGWHEVPGGRSRFAVDEGVLKIEDGAGFLETDETYADFLLHVESNIHDQKAIADDRPANSGVFFRAIRGTDDAPSHGYEMQIQHDYKDDDRAQPLDFGAGAIYRRKPARYIVANNNEWVVQTLIAQGNRFAGYVNGYQVLMWSDNRDPDLNPRRGLRLDAGHISLQGHDPTTDIEFRSLRIHTLPSSTR